MHCILITINGLKYLSIRQKRKEAKRERKTDIKRKSRHILTSKNLMETIIFVFVFSYSLLNFSTFKWKIDLFWAKYTTLPFSKQISIHLHIIYILYIYLYIYIYLSFYISICFFKKIFSLSKLKRVWNYFMYPKIWFIVTHFKLYNLHN